MPEARPLPLGRSTFSTLRAENALYVDKTAQLFKLCQQTGAKVFLSRPRRFGKSLLVTTFESLFKYGLRDFSGLAIEKFWRDKTYTVVRLDFSEVQSFSSADEFESQFLSYVAALFHDEAGFRGAPTLLDLSRWLSKERDNGIVLLIDEYDAPLTASLERPEHFEKVQNLLNQFFLMLEAHGKWLRFCFVSGITKLANAESFSGLNNFEDISRSPAYGALLGFTESEICNQFPAYIARAATALKCSEEDIRAKLRLHYSGFCFDKSTATHVYCPWSVLKFFDEPSDGFLHYWFHSGGKPTVLLKDLHTTHRLEDICQYFDGRSIGLNELDATWLFQGLDSESLLLQAGYLTIKKLVMPGYVEIGYPNQEVAVSMAQLYSDELLRDANRALIGLPMIKAALAEESLDKIVSLFNNVFHAIDYQNYPVTDEATCRAMLQVLLIGTDMIPKVEVHTAHGRNDLEVEVGQRRWVFEIKFARTEAEENKLLNQGITQMNKRQYGETFASDSKKALMRAVLVFSRDKRQFVRWSMP